ncbi:4Fe-4S binding protein [Parvibacter caecicola]|uniref:4Fe-4S binding protein n=1 Tax=Parvibacter caecicola TaxID=747645 RepID=UPI0023F2B93F|nr:4Fe-4S binding protein [Parvibacter caecicola]
MKPSTVRTIVVVAVFGLVGVSLATHAATGTLSAIGYDSIALICPVGALEVMLGAKEFLLHPLLLLGLAIVAALVAGKAFCGWLCPTPLLQRLFKGKGKKPAASADAAPVAPERTDDPSVDSPALGACGTPPAAGALSAACSPTACGHSCKGCGSLPPVGGKRDGFHLDTRFAVLGGALASAAVFGFPVFCLVCPVGLTFATFIGLWHLFQFNETTWGLLIFPAILVLELVVLRKWCHKFCPISAVLSLVSQGNRTLRPRVSQEKCLRTRGIDCRACVEACPEQLDPHASNIAECTKCGQCKEKCPAQAISFPLLSFSGTKGQKVPRGADGPVTKGVDEPEAGISADTDGDALLA